MGYGRATQTDLPANQPAGLRYQVLRPRIIHKVEDSEPHPFSGSLERKEKCIMTRDRVCDNRVQPAQPTAEEEVREHESRMHALLFPAAADICAANFDPDPNHYLRLTVEVAEQEKTVTDPVCGMEIDPQSALATRRHEGQLFYFCSTRCAKTYDEAQAMLDSFFGG